MCTHAFAQSLIVKASDKFLPEKWGFSSFIPLYQKNALKKEKKFLCLTLYGVQTK